MTITKEISNFIKIGILNTSFYYVIYSLLLFAGFTYILSVFIATICGVLFNFKTFSKYVFYNENKRRIIRFISVYFFLYVINILFINFFNILVADYYISGFLAVFPYAFFSFYLNKKFVFAKDNY